jgi:hypothetical protein
VYRDVPDWRQGPCKSHYIQKGDVWRFVMPLTELEDRQAAESWSAEEEMVIKTIQQTECVPRPEAIRRMQRRKKVSRWAAGGTSPGCEGILGSGRRCWNPRCTKGEDGGRGSLAHLRADARYCGAACKKAAQRSLNLNPA